MKNSFMNAVYGLFIPYFRKKRAALFLKMFPDAEMARIVDVGGLPQFWSMVRWPGRVVCININRPEVAQETGDIAFVEGDAMCLPLPDGACDIVFSNSVIEHLGEADRQMKFADEIRRAGRSYWVQTPNRRFFVEPHLVAPFIHYLPRSVQAACIRWMTPWGLLTRPSRDEVVRFLDEVKLLTEEDMHRLFPDAEIVVERFMGMKKSFIAVKR